MNGMRDILLVNWNDRTNPWGGGAEIHLHEMFGRLAADGHRVTLLCSGFDGAPAEEELDGIRVLRVGGRYTFNFVLPFHLRRLVRARRPDIVVDALNKIPLCTPLYAGVPVLGIGHHLFGTTIFREVPPPLSLYVWLSELAVPRVYRGVTMEVISKSTGEDFAARGLDPDRIRVVYVGIDSSQYRAPDSELRTKKPTLLALGRIRKYKRLDLVVDTVVELARKKVPDLTLTIAGTGNHLPALKEQVARLAAEDVVTFAGLVSEEEKVRLYQSSWALVMTSPKEGWGLTCLEAEACGTPVIASDSPGLREAVRDGTTGFLVPHGDRVALHAALEKFLGDPELRAELGRGALEYAAGFSWARAARETLGLIEEAIAEGGGS